MWYGAALGIVLSLILGAIFIIIFYVAKNAVYDGAGKEIFEGAISWFASLLITILAFAMLRFYNIEARFKYKLESAARKVRRGSWASACCGPSKLTISGRSSTGVMCNWL